MEGFAPDKATDVSVRDTSPSHDGSDKNVAQAYYSGRRAPMLSEQTRVRKVFSFAQIFFFALTYMSSWETMCSNVTAVLYNGGPQTLAWGIVIVACGAMAQAASLAEMASIQPIAGAQYHWTAFLAPQRHRRFITWFQGWITWFAWVSMLAGVSNVTAYIIQGLATSNYPDYVPERWHLTLIIFAILTVECLMNMYTFWLIPWIEMMAGILHVVLFIIFVVVLVVMAPKHSAHYVFFERASFSGWNNDFVSWNLGLLTPTWGFVGFDGAVHMSEEVRKARHAVPRAMFWTIALNAVLAYTICIVILFTMGDQDELLNSSFPMMTILTNTTGSLSAATAMVCGLLLISLSVNLASIASVSRLTWAWSRDGALPAYFSYISPKYHIPVRAVILPTVVTACLALLNIASTAAFGAFIALTSMALFTSYFIAIACLLYARLRGTCAMGGWNLGKFGVPVNIFALVYTLYIFAFLPVPAYLPVTGLSMNYSGPIWGASVLFTLGLWFVWGRKNWPGLNEEVVDIVLAHSDKATKD